jgi:hypothetical protein
VAKTFDYQLFGLRIRSEIEMPELFSATEGEPDVLIRRGSAGDGPSEPGLQPDGDALVLTISDVARYRIEGGERITVEAQPGVPPGNVRLFLLGSVFGVLLHQRGLLPLHANAVEIEGRAVAFMGESGAGKSTLAAWFHDHGYRVVTDDVCVICFDPSGCPIAAPGLPRLRLWDETLRATGRNSGDHPRSYLGDEQFDKYDLLISASAATDAELPLTCLYLLDRAEEMSVQRLNGLEAAEAVFAHTYRGAFVAAVGSQSRHWQNCVRLVASTPLFRVGRPWDLEQLDEQCEMLVEHARELRPVRPSDRIPS